MTLTTTRLGLSKPESTDSTAELREAIGANADILERLSPAGVFAATSDLTLTSSMQNVPGASGNLIFTGSPFTPVKLLIIAVFDFLAPTSAVDEMQGTVFVGANEQAELARFAVPSSASPQRATVSQLYSVEVDAAGSYSVGLRAKDTGATHGTCKSPGSKLLYQVIPA